jgi:DNA-binding LacI/PurR family transcriptional regulator
MAVDTPVIIFVRALEHLVSLGHRKIAFIKGHENSSDTEDRWDAVLVLQL